MSKARTLHVCQYFLPISSDDNKVLTLNQCRQSPASGSRPICSVFCTKSHGFVRVECLRIPAVLGLSVTKMSHRRRHWDATSSSKSLSISLKCPKNLNLLDTFLCDAFKAHRSAQMQHNWERSAPMPEPQLDLNLRLNLGIARLCVEFLKPRSCCRKGRIRYSAHDVLSLETSLIQLAAG